MIVEAIEAPAMTAGGEDVQLGRYVVVDAGFVVEYAIVYRNCPIVLAQGYIGHGGVVFYLQFVGVLIFQLFIGGATQQVVA